LREKQKLLRPLQLIQDVQTRWNYVVDMIVRFLEQQAVVQAAVTSNELRRKDKNASFLSQVDIDNLKDVLDVLNPAKRTSTAL